MANGAVSKRNEEKNTMIMIIFEGSGLASTENERFPNRLPPSGQCYHDADYHHIHEHYNHYDHDYHASFRPTSS